MTKIQTKRRDEAMPKGKISPRFEIVREGEPLPEIALRPVRKPRLRRARSAHVPETNETPHCPLCDGLITRFDMQIYEQHHRCGPCQEALS